MQHFDVGLIGVIKFEWKVWRMFSIILGELLQILLACQVGKGAALEDAQFHPHHVPHSDQSEESFHQWVTLISSCEFPIWCGVDTNLILPDDNINATRGVGLYTWSAGATAMLLEMVEHSSGTDYMWPGNASRCDEINWKMSTRDSHLFL